MASKFDENMNDIFNLAPVEVESAIVDINSENKISADANKDYEYSRATLYNLIQKGEEAVNGILDVAQNTDHPRAFEVAALTIKNVADVAEKLVDLQKKMKDLQQEAKTSSPTTVNNTMFVGSTADLAKMLKQASKDLKDK
jgi:hypothetical protein